MEHSELLQHLSYDPLTGQFARLSAAGGLKIGQSAGWDGQNGYRYVNIRGEKHLAHRLAWFYVHGRWPAVFLDHINGDSRDNRIANLREASKRQNCTNRTSGRNNTSGHPGVYWHKPTQNWTAMVFRNGKTISLGYFRTFEAAVAARQEAAVREYGHFVRGGVPRSA